jgi:hypothetical protein
MKAQRAGGSRSMWDLLRHPSELVKDPLATGVSKLQSDREAIASGETREVSCWLRGTAPGLPEKLTQGYLFVGPQGMTWRRWWGGKRNPLISIPQLDRVEQVIKPAGTSTGRQLKRGMFTNVVATGPSGRVEFVVPGVGPALIRQVIDDTSR